MGRLLFRGRLKALKGVQKAAALMAAGRLDEAAAELERWKPRVYLEDVSVYHFVAGRLHMERGQLEEAETHLMAARALGLGTASLNFVLAVLKARQCQMAEALVLLDGVAQSLEPGFAEQADAVRKAVGEVLSGEACKALRKQAERFARDELKSALSQGQEVRPLADRLERYLSGQKLPCGFDEGRRSGAVALMGEILVQCCRGAWQLGLQATDHRVVVRGATLFPCRIVEDVIEGRLLDLTKMLDAPLEACAERR